ncbi:MAG: hypothetical protein HYX27_08570 [Acidobacteria bacterium]|nr:hypothetical protein [Acidobacteriota bacterium]
MLLTKKLYLLGFFAIAAAGGLAAQNSILVNTTAISLSSQAGSLTPVSQSISVSSNNTQFGFQVSVIINTPAGGTWLTVDRASAVTPSIVVVSATAGTLAAGSYTGSVNISSAGTTNSPVTIPVTFTVGAGTQLQSAPTALTFNYQLGGATPASQNLSVSSVTAGIGFTAAVQLITGSGWLEVTPTTGTTPANLSVSVPPAILQSAAPGTYTGTIVLTPTSGTGTALQVPVTLNVTGTPQYMASPANVVFNYQTGQATPAQQTINVTQLGGTSAFTVSSTTSGGGNWLVVTPLSGVTPAVLTVGVQQPSALPPGTYNGSIVVTSFSGQPGPLTISVSLTVSNAPLLSIAPNSLKFDYQPGSAIPAPLTLTPTSTSTAVNFTATATATGGNWLSVNPVSGSTPNPISVSVDPTGLLPGVYTGTVTVAGVGTGNGPQSVPVTLTVTSNPIITASASSLTFNYQLGKDAPGAQIVNVNSTGGPFNYTIVGQTITGSGYLSVSATSGTTPGSFSVSMVPAVIAAGAPGVYSARVTITAPGAANSPLVIPITLNLSDKALVNVSPASLSFNFQGTGSLPLPQFISLTSTGEAANFSVSSTSTGGWLTVGPSSGTTPANVTVQVTPLGLLPGTYKGSITITANIPGGGATLNSPITVPVTLTISAGSLSAAPASLSFTQAQGAAAPPAQTVNITSSGTVLNYSTVATSPVGSWLSVTPANGATPGALSVSVNGAGLAPGTYNGSVTVSSPGASNSPLTIPVSLTIGTGQTLTVSPTTLSFSHQIGAASPASKTISLTTTGAALNYTAVAATTGNGAWLGVSPGSGATPGTLTVNVNPSGLTAGTYNGTITITSAGASNSPQVVNVTLTVTTVPAPVPTAVVNAASFAPGPIAPGEILTIGGTNLGPATPASFQVNAVGFVDPTLADTRVLFDSIPGIVLYTSPNQINVIAPYGIFGRPAVRMTVSYLNQTSASIDLRVVDTAPGIFGTPNSTQGAILNQNFTINGANNPAAKNSVISVFATGEGQTTPGGQDGRVIPVDINQLKKPLFPVTATVGGIAAQVEYYGSAPGLISGVMQVNIRVAPNTPSGNQPVVILVGASPSQANLTAAIQ